MNFSFSTALMALIVIVIKLFYPLDDQYPHRRDILFADGTAPNLKAIFEALPSFGDWALSAREDALLPCQMPYFARYNYSNFGYLICIYFSISLLFRFICFYNPFFSPSELWRLPRTALSAYAKFCGDEVFSHYEAPVGAVFSYACSTEF